MHRRTEVKSPYAVPALIFGTGATALGVLRRLSRLGVACQVVLDHPEVVERSRRYRAALLSTGAIADVGLAEALSALPLERAVLFPCSDSWLLAVAALPKSLNCRFPAAVPPQKAALAVVDKGSFAEALERIGVPHAQTFPLSGPHSLDRVPESVYASAFLKPRHSQPFRERFGVKGVWVRSRDEAASQLEVASQAGFEMELQEYVPGPASNHYFIDGYVDRCGAIRALFARRRLRMFPLDFGNSTYQTSVAPEECGPAVDSVRRLLEGIGFRGIFSAEFKRDVRDGAFKILELNGRPWLYVEFAARCGIDVVSLAYHDAVGIPLENVPSYRVGVTCVHPYTDYHACRAVSKNTPAALLRWSRSLMGSMQPIFRWTDPWPFVHWVGSWGAGYLGRHLLGRRSETGGVRGEVPRAGFNLGSEPGSKTADSNDIFWRKIA